MGYRDYLDLNNPSALTLGIEGQDADANRARAERAHQFVAEFAQVEEAAYQNAHWANEPNVPGPGIARLLARHEGDMVEAVRDPELVELARDHVDLRVTYEPRQTEDGVDLTGPEERWDPLEHDPEAMPLLRDTINQVRGYAGSDPVAEDRLQEALRGGVPAFATPESGRRVQVVAERGVDPQVEGVDPTGRRVFLDSPEAVGMWLDCSTDDAQTLVDGLTTQAQRRLNNPSYLGRPPESEVAQNMDLQPRPLDDGPGVDQAEGLAASSAAAAAIGETRADVTPTTHDDAIAADAQRSTAEARTEISQARGQRGRGARGAARRAVEVAGVVRDSTLQRLDRITRGLENVVNDSTSTPLGARPERAAPSTQRRGPTIG